MLYVGYNKTI